MVKLKTTAEPGKRIGKHGGNRSGHHARGAEKVTRAGRQGAERPTLKHSEAGLN
jgi:hypothetical protein